MIHTLQSEFEALKRDIRELKTAQTRPSTFTVFAARGTMALGRYSVRTTYLWRIYFEDTGDTNPPIITTGFIPAQALRPYDVTNNTQDIQYYSNYDAAYSSDQTFYIESSRPISRIIQLTSPGPLNEWEQVRSFYPADMGTTPGWCLQNTRLGFHIYSGTFPTARADMNSQIANGTLHSGTPPDYIACAVYWDNSVAEGHIGAWDHGTIYSDGAVYPSFDAIDRGYRGWGEFCDGQRVVQHV